MKRNNRKAHGNHERWLVSYADFITLMFAFFVVLYASSQTDIRKQAQVAQSINEAFKALGLFQPDNDAKSGVVSTDKAVTPVNVVLGDELSAQPSAAVKADFERMHRELQAGLSNQIAQHVVALRVGREGLVISLRDAGFYDSGSITPHPGSIGSIDSIVSVLRPRLMTSASKATPTTSPSTPESSLPTGSSRPLAPPTWHACSSSTFSSNRATSPPPDTPNTIPSPPMRAPRAAVRTGASTSSCCPRSTEYGRPL